MMKGFQKMNKNPYQPSRRTLLKGAAALTSSAILPGALSRPTLAAAPPLKLRVDTRTIEVKGKAAKVFGIFNEAGGHGVNKVFDGRFAVELTNALQEETMVHWHGLAPPVTMDGTPMLSGPPLKPGETVTYDFPSRVAGTHWMHSHVGLQEQQMLAAPLIIRESATPLVDEQEHVVMLHDFSFTPAAELLAKLKSGSGGQGGMMQGMMNHGGGMMSGGSGNMMQGMMNGMMQGSQNGMMMPGGMVFEMSFSLSPTACATVRLFAPTSMSALPTTVSLPLRLAAPDRSSPPTLTVATCATVTGTPWRCATTAREISSMVRMRASARTRYDSPERWMKSNCCLKMSPVSLSKPTMNPPITSSPAD